MTALDTQQLAEIKDRFGRINPNGMVGSPILFQLLAKDLPALIAEVEKSEELRERLAEESAGRAWAWDTAKGWQQRAVTAEAAASAPLDLLREAAELIDALDLGVESDGCAALVRRIRAHLATIHSSERAAKGGAR